MLSCFNLKGTVVRVVQYTRPTLLPLFTRRCYASAIDAISLERQQEIAAALRVYQKDNMAVPWFDMARRYRISQAAMEQALAADNARLEKRAELLICVTQMANRAYDEQRGRCDWESIARDMEMPLIECLRLFDPSLSTVTVRSLPNITDWSAVDLSTLKSLVLEQFGAVTADEWSLVSVYMNVAQNDCFMAHNMCTNPRMTPDLHKAITRHRNDGLTWWDILKEYPLYSNTSGLRDVYRRFKERDGSKPKAKIIKWYDADTCRIKEIIQAYYKPGNWRELLTQAQMAFPNRTEASILGKIKMTICKASDITNNDMDRVNKLVEAYGKDWQRIGQEIDASPRRAERIWTLYQQRQKSTQAWTDDELDILRKCIRDGVGMTEASLLIGTKTISACNAKMQLLKRQGSNIPSQKSNTIWNADDIARLEHLVSTYERREIDWTAIGKDLGRSAGSCRLKHGKLDRDYVNPTIDHSQTVSHEVQKQYGQQQSVDWTKVAHLLGLTERQCLEANQFNTGKARWIYHPDTFSWDMANRMTAFIKDNYPKPLVINYTAVSNYMWINKSDCVKMASLLRGEIEWTAETIDQVTKLREQGMKFVDIARQLSPTLSLGKVAGAYHSHIDPKVYIPLSNEEKQQVKDIMDTHAEQISFTELRALVSQKMPHVNQRALRSFVYSHAVSLPVYKARLHNADTDKIASQILNGTKSSKLAAQLDIPPTLLTSLMASNTFSMHSSTWTPHETEKLLEYIRSNTRPYKWKLVSEVIGTKSPNQCRSKIAHLKITGKVA